MSKKDIIRTLVDDYLNTGDESVAERTWTQDYKWRPGSGTGEPKDRVTHRTERHDLQQMFPDFQKRIDVIVEEGDYVATVCTQWGTHSGMMRTPGGGEIAPTGNHVEWNTISMHRFDGDEVAEGWIVWDFTDILRQVGVLKEWKDPVLHSLAAPRQGRVSTTGVARGMSSAAVGTAKKVARQALNAHLTKPDSWGRADLFHPDYRARQGWRDDQEAQRLTDIFADLDVEVDAQVSEGEFVATRGRIKGRQHATMLTPFGEARSSGRSAEWMLMTMHQVRGGRILQEWTVHDPLRMLQQLDHAPAWPPGST